MGTFTYDAEKHLGFVDGKLIPSITQLLDLDFPMGNISESVLKQASERGSFIHHDIELYNQGAIERCNTASGVNYQRLVKSFSMGVFDTEKQVLIKDESGEIIAYGTLDIVLAVNEDNLFAKKGELVLADVKTVSQFNNAKVELQTNMYAFGYEQMGIAKIDKLAGIWVRTNEKENIAQIRVFEKYDADKTYKIIVDLVNHWKEKQK